MKHFLLAITLNHRNSLFNWLVILFISILSFSSCSKDESSEEIAKGIELVTDTRLIIANGTSAAQIKLFKDNNSIIDVNEYVLRMNGELIDLDNFEFTTNTNGSYTFEAEYKGVITNSIEVTAREVKAYSKITIPIVFHVGHFGTLVSTAVNSEINPNASQETIDEAIVQLNKVFGNELGSIVPNAVDTNIEFRLATLKPSGETLLEPGIMRYNISSYDTGCAAFLDIPDCVEVAEDDALGYSEAKPFAAATIWNPKEYVNIWIYPIQPGSAFGGYATSFPPVDERYPLEGTLLASLDEEIQLSIAFEEGQYFPEFSLDFKLLNSVLAHEMGHSLALQHPQAGNCEWSDFCDDTYSYNDITNQPCENNLGSSYYNSAMDYKGEQDCFTYDQRERMRHVLEHGVWLSMLKDSDK